MSYELSEQELELIMNAPVTPMPDGPPLLPGHYAGTSGFQYAMGYNPETGTYDIDQSIDTIFSTLDRDGNGTVGRDDVRDALTRLVSGFVGDNSPILTAVLAAADGLLAIFAGPDNEFSRDEANTIADRYDGNHDREMDRGEFRNLAEHYRGDVQEVAVPLIGGVLQNYSPRGAVPAMV